MSLKYCAKCDTAYTRDADDNGLCRQCSDRQEALDEYRASCLRDLGLPFRDPANFGDCE